jgi:ribosome-binding factor A
MANPSYPRSLRLAKTVRRLVSEWLEDEQINERQPGLVTVTDVKVTADLHRATVFYTVLGAADDRASAEARLAESTPQARAYVAHHVRLRHAPTLEFVSDDLPAHGARIDQLLDEIGPREHGTPEHGTPEASGSSFPTDSGSSFPTDEEDPTA